jgi:hypothetical protein
MLSLPATVRLKLDAYPETAENKTQRHRIASHLEDEEILVVGGVLSISCGTYVSTVLEHFSMDAFETITPSSVLNQKAPFRPSMGNLAQYIVATGRYV